MWATGALAVPGREVRRTVPLDANGQVTVDTHNGMVTITTWNKPSVDISGRIVPDSDNTAEEVAATEIVISGEGSSVRIETNYDRLPLRWFGLDRNSPPVHYTITMPATARLSIDSHNSTIRVSGLRSDLRIADHQGEIDVTGHEGPVAIEAHNGDVSVAFTRFLSPA